jgi:hypothetical protein
MTVIVAIGEGGATAELVVIYVENNRVCELTLSSNCFSLIDSLFSTDCLQSFIAKNHVRQSRQYIKEEQGDK